VKTDTPQRSTFSLPSLVTALVIGFAVTPSCKREAVSTEGPSSNEGTANAVDATVDGLRDGAGVPAADSLATLADAEADRIRITTNTIKPEEVGPIPGAFEFLYVTGEGVASTVNSLLVDGDTLFWGGQGLIWRAPRDGTGEPVAFAYWEDAQVSAFASDATYLYWHDRSALKRKRKDSAAVAHSPPRVRHNFPWGADGFDFTYQQEIESLDLGVDYSVAHFYRLGTQLYLAPTDCTPIYVIDLDTFAQRETLRFERPESTGGSSSLVVSVDRVYCKNSSSLFVIDRDGKNAKTLSTELQRGGALAAPDAPLSGDPVAYVLDFTGPGRAVHIKAVQPGGDLDDYGESPVAGAADLASGLRFDPLRRNLAWLGAGGGGDGFWLATLNVDTRQFSPVRPLFSTTSFTSDEDYYYWVGRLTAANEITTVLRLHKDAVSRAAGAYAAQ